MQLHLRNTLTPNSLKSLIFAKFILILIMKKFRFKNLFFLGFVRTADGSLPLVTMNLQQRQRITTILGLKKTSILFPEIHTEIFLSDVMELVVKSSESQEESFVESLSYSMTGTINNGPRFKEFCSLLIETNNTCFDDECQCLFLQSLGLGNLSSSLSLELRKLLNFVVFWNISCCLYCKNTDSWLQVGPNKVQSFFLKLEGHFWSAVVSMGSQVPDDALNNSTALSNLQFEDESRHDNKTSSEKEGVNGASPLHSENENCSHLPSSETPDGELVEDAIRFVQVDVPFETNCYKLSSVPPLDPHVANCCQKCLRWATSEKPFELQQRNVSELICRNLGARLPQSANVNLCSQCCHYCEKGHARSQWSDAWPSFFASLLFDKGCPRIVLDIVAKLLPPSFFAFWRGHPSMNTIDSSRCPILTDVTQRHDRTRQLMRCDSYSDIESLLRTEDFPYCRCPFGCTEFVEKIKTIPFHHFLNKFFPFLNNCGASWQKTLKGARTDFLQKFVYLEQFEISPAFMITDSGGLGLVTCSDDSHAKGSKLQFVHVPVNPVSGHVPPRHCNRLAAAVPTIKNFTNEKLSYNCHQFRLIELSGNFNGLSTVRLTKKRRWDVTNQRLAESEAQILGQRSDLVSNVSKLVMAGELVPPVAQSLLKLSASTTQDLSKLPDSTVIINADSVHYHPTSRSLNSCPVKQLVAHPVDAHGATPFPINHLHPGKLLNWAVSVVCNCNFKMRTKLKENADPALVQVFKSSLTCCVKKNKTDSLGPQTGPREIAHYLVQNFYNVVHSEASSFDELGLQNKKADVTSTDILIFSRNSTHRNQNQISVPFILEDNDDTFELVLIMSITRDHKSLALSRYGGCFNLFWEFHSDLDFPFKNLLEPCDAISSGFDGRWSLVVYNRIPKISVTEYFLDNCLGQNKLFCSVHKLPLIVRNIKGGISCNSCTLKACLSCPVGTCSAAVCRKHLKFFRDGHDEKHYIHPITTEVDFDVITKTSDAVDPLGSFGDDKTDFHAIANTGVTMVDSSDDESPQLESNSGVVPQFAEVSDDVNGATPCHWLLNGVCGLLQRGTKITLSKVHQRFMENLTATTPGNTVPLNDIEALLYPSIFYHQLQDGSYPGCLPAALMSGGAVNKQLGFHTMADHMTLRMKDASLLTSGSQDYLQFAFDACFNLALETTDNRFVLERGLQEADLKTQENYIRRHAKLNFDAQDSRAHVLQLAAALRKKQATYFFTYTCNQSQHPGVSSLFNAIEKKYPGQITEKAIKADAVNAEMVMLLRIWQRASSLVMTYIEKSSEQPLGPVQELWYRYEFQDKAGALPHIHAVIWTHEDPFSSEVRERIVCETPRFRGELVKKLAELGLEKSLSEINDLCELFGIVQTHNCEAAKRRCCKETERHGVVCRVPKYPASLEYSYKPVYHRFSEECVDLLMSMDLAHFNDTVCRVIASAELAGGKHHYPASYREHISPTNPLIFSLIKSSCNVQICDPYLSARYIAKYAAGVEVRSTVTLKAGSQSNVLGATESDLKNEKITGVRFHSNNEEGKVVGRKISSTECAWWLLDFPYVFSNIEFIHIPTTPKRFRPGFYHRKKVPNHQFTSSGCNLNDSRTDLPAWRQFTSYQIRTLQEETNSMLTVDKVTIFSLRPPELLFVDNMESYFSFFKRLPLKKANLRKFAHKQLDKSLLVDGMGYAVKIRSNQLLTFQSFTESSDSIILTSEMKQFVSGLRGKHLRHVWHSPTKYVVTYFSEVEPRNFSRFLCHILLSLGHFQTEIEVFSGKSMLKSFEIVKLVSNCQNVNRNEVITILKNYLLSQLKFCPGSSKVLDKSLLDADFILSGLLLKKEMSFNEVPIVYDSHLQSVISDECAKLWNDLKENQLRSILEYCSDLPPPEVVVRATLSNQVPWKPLLNKLEKQSTESFLEQTMVLGSVLEAVDNLVSGQYPFVKHQILTGPPGTGKTFLLCQALAYSMCKGLFPVVTSLASERASSFGGVHLDKLLPFPIDKNIHPFELASRAIEKLVCRPSRIMFLSKIHVLFVEELSMISAEKWLAADLVFQFLSDKKIPFGGRLVIASADFKQLPPPNGTMLLLEPSILTLSKFHVLRQFVRMEQEQGQRLLQLMRKTQLTPEEIIEVTQIIRENCNFVRSWSEVPVNAIRVVATREAEIKAIKDKIADLQSRQIDVFTCKAKDEVACSGLNEWQNASSKVTNKLNRIVNEPEELTVFKGALLRFTANLHANDVSQGHFDEKTLQSLDVIVVPPGVRDLESCSEDLIKQWPVLSLKRSTGISQKFGIRYIRRIQFPVKYHAGATVHKSMGSTVACLGTTLRQDIRDYRLWCRAQLYVLFSRVRKLNDIYLVSSQNTMESTVSELLTKRTEEDEFLDELFRYIENDTNSSIVINQFAVSPLFPSGLRIPTTNVGFVFILRSLRHPTEIYVGECVKLDRALKQHNSGQGNELTNCYKYRPWGIALYVFGFSSTSESQNFLKRKTLQMRVTSELERKKAQRIVLNLDCLRAAVSGKCLSQKLIFN